jgi:hypothetical protein
MVLACAHPFRLSSPVQCSAKQGREELLTAAVERGPSQGARSGSKESSSRPCSFLRRPRIARAQRYWDCFDEPSRFCQYPGRRRRCMTARTTISSMVATYRMPKGNRFNRRRRMSCFTFGAAFGWETIVAIVRSSSARNSVPKPVDWVW